jgi:hypothetical protein
MLWNLTCAAPLASMPRRQSAEKQAAQKKNGITRHVSRRYAVDIPARLISTSNAPLQAR